MDKEYDELVINSLLRLLKKERNINDLKEEFKLSEIDILDPHTKPNILLIGHYHKFYMFSYRNVQRIEVPCLCTKTQFQQKQGLINTVGGYFLKIYSDKLGNIQYFEPEEILFDKKEFWDETGKDKRKVKQLVISNGVY